MKTVYPSDELSHLWAHSAQPSARTATSNFSFEGPDLYSYRTIIATKLDDMVFLSDAQHSVTTSRQQRLARRAVGYNNEVLYVPTLDGIQDLRRRKGDGDKTLPDLAKTCAEYIRQQVAELSGRRSATEMAAVLDKAQKYQASGLALCKYVGCKKWPLPLLPSELPTDKAEREALILLFAKQEIQEKYELELAGATRAVTRLQSCEHDVRFFATTFQKVVNRGLVYCDDAKAKYKQLHKKASAKVNALEKQLWSLQTEAEPRIAAAKLDLADIEIEHQLALGENCNLYQLTNAYAENPDTKYKPQVEKRIEVEQAKQAAKALQRAQNLLASGDSYQFDRPRDALRTYREARSIAETLQDSDLLQTLASRIVDTEDKLRCQEAGRKEAWISGQSDTRPAYELGHFARIKGDQVETTGGARVPLDAAIRLAKIARRVIREGGKTWERGTGPMVGHYRVDSVSIDGATVIGCHRFEAEESLRMMALLELAGDVQDQLKQTTVS